MSQDKFFVVLGDKPEHFPYKEGSMMHGVMETYGTRSVAASTYFDVIDALTKNPGLHVFPMAQGVWLPRDYGGVLMPDPVQVRGYKSMPVVSDGGRLGVAWEMDYILPVGAPQHVMDRIEQAVEQATTYRLDAGL